jgi:DNA polymerase (family 10)
MQTNKNMTNVEIAKLLRSIAAAYEIKDNDKNKFRIIAYERAADAIEHLSSEAKDLWDDGKLDDVAGIGSSISQHLGEIFSKGKSKHFQYILSNIPTAVFDLLPIEGVGPKTSFKLVKELNLSSPNSIKKLLKKCEEGKVSKLEGFGEDSEKAIIKSIKEISGREKRLLFNYAENISEEIISWMNKNHFVERVDALGSLRRRASTIGDIDISVSTNNTIEVIKHFTKYPKSSRVLEKGERTASIILPGNIQVDLMVQEPKSYGSLLQHFTGSKHHNIALREYALKKNLSLSEYGITKKFKSKKNIKYNFSSEKEFYNFLEMGWIPPELREDTGEIDAALNSFLSKSQGLPKLIELEDVKSDLQIHSDFDIETSHDLGESSMMEIAKKGDILGYEYLAFTEHNPSQRGHTEKNIMNILKRKKDYVEKINYSISQSNFKRLKKVFNSLEVDILPNAKLPISEKSLDFLDFVLVSIHSSFRKSRNKMTQRILGALSYPKVKIFAHPTARKLNEREGIELDWDKIFEYCKNNNIWLEINADPMRLDLPDYLVKQAVKNDIKLTLGTDSHHKDHMDNMKYGVYVARRGWAEKKDIVNTNSLEEFEMMIK